MRLRESLGHHLAGSVQIGTRLEDEEDPRKPGHGLGADVLEEGDAVQQVLLEWDGDELFDLARGQPECLGLDLDGRRCEVGQDLDRHLTEL